MSTPERRNNSKERSVLESKRLIYYLYQQLGLEKHFDFSLTVKKLEGALIYNLLGFNNSSSFNQNDRFDVNPRMNGSSKKAQYEYQRLIKKLEKHLSVNQTLQLRFHLNSQVSSNNPVMYIRNQAELDQLIEAGNFKIDSNSADPNLIKSNGQETVFLPDVSQVDIFHQQASDKKTVTGFNHQAAKELHIALGGGIRLQFDTVQGDEFFFTASSSWGDVGTRATSREGKFYQQQPFFEKKISLKLDHQGRFNYIGPRASNIVDGIEIEECLDSVLASIFEKNGAQLAQLFLALNQVQARSSKYSVEVAFSLQAGDWKLKVTSFDGLCTALDVAQNDQEIDKAMADDNPARNTLLLAKIQQIMTDTGQDMVFLEQVLSSLSSQRDLATNEVAIMLEPEQREQILSLIKNSLDKLTGQQSIEQSEENLFGEMLKQFGLQNNHTNWGLRQLNSVHSAISNKDFVLNVFESSHNPQLQLVFLEFQGIALAYLFVDGQLQQSAADNLSHQFEFCKKQLKTIGCNSFPNLAVSHFRHHD